MRITLEVLGSIDLITTSIMQSDVERKRDERNRDARKRDERKRERERQSDNQSMRTHLEVLCSTNHITTTSTGDSECVGDVEEKERESENE